MGSKNSFTKSFYDWCIDNNKQDILDRWNYELNSILPNKIGYASHNKCWFKCEFHKNHDSELFWINNITCHKAGIKCKQCNSIAQYLIDTYGDGAIDDYWDGNKNKENPWFVSRSTAKAYWFKCIEKKYHGSYYITCNNFIKGRRCPYCSHKGTKLHTNDSLGVLYPQILDIWSDKNKKSPYEYFPMSNIKAWCKCMESEHNDYYRPISRSVICDFRCPECTRERDESFLQEKVRTYITEKYQYKLNHENKCSIVPKNPKSKRPMPYDNEIVDLNLIIEVHGVSHYRADNFIHIKARKDNITPEQALHKRKLYDRYKRIVAKHSGYFYLEIPYWTEDDESYKVLIDNKIEEILKEKEV